MQQNSYRALFPNFESRSSKPLVELVLTEEYSILRCPRFRVSLAPVDYCLETPDEKEGKAWRGIRNESWYLVSLILQ